MRIQVTEDDISKSREIFRDYHPLMPSPQRAHSCPVALAVARLKNVKDVTVGCDCAFLTRKRLFGLYEKRTCHDLPAAARSFIASFDAREPVQPFAFDLE